MALGDRLGALPPGGAACRRRGPGVSAGRSVRGTSDHARRWTVAFEQALGRYNGEGSPDRDRGAAAQISHPTV